MLCPESHGLGLLHQFKTDYRPPKPTRMRTAAERVGKGAPFVLPLAFGEYQSSCVMVLVLSEASSRSMGYWLQTFSCRDYSQPTWARPRKPAGRQSLLRGWGIHQQGWGLLWLTSGPSARYFALWFAVPILVGVGTRCVCALDGYCGLEPQPNQTSIASQELHLVSQCC